MKESAIPYSQISLQFDNVQGQKTARICLQRPESLNRIDEQMAEEIRDACQKIGADEYCRLLTVTGSGGCFSIGRTALKGEAGNMVQQMARLKVADAVAALSIPVLISLNGNATGQGLELALAGDLRIAVDSANISLWDNGQPAVPWDGGTQRLPRSVGPAWALDMALTGRTVNAAEALRLGLVNRVVPAGDLEDASREMAEQVLASAPIAARYAKEAIGKGMELTLEQGLGLEADLSVILQSTHDRAEGISSFSERRPPRFEGA